tara:strand:- start:1120 stop:1773 length:654 start_codon:yes stop_codon:yes gene_type:complete
MNKTQKKEQDKESVINKQGELDDTHYDNVYITGGREQIYFKNPFDVPIYSELWSSVAFEILQSEDANQITDMGCGPGHLPYILRSAGIEQPYTGYDFSKVAIQMAEMRQLPDCTFINKNLYDMGDLPVSLFTCLEVLEHIEKDLELVAQIPTGCRLLFSVPTYDSHGHVRKFKDHDEIRERYGEMFDLEFIDEIFVRYTEDEDPIEHKIFLFSGIRK